MTKQICPVCGFDIGGEGYKKDGIIYCCEPCAESGNCGCHQPKTTDMPDAGGE